MSPFFAVFLVLLLASSSYAAGRLHGQLSYRIGYRFGYRQGYFDGDRGAWNHRRRDAQAAIAAVLPAATPAALATPGAPDRPAGAELAARQGTTYTGAAFVGASASGRHSKEVLTGPRP
ncbi:hypothetical protein [Micromonospora sp. NBC_01813]|uniref:hypothetical protein n=1 Tax=Micromonospora sp. NBC_01813 TaxID=2975988 RepID=UPI002DD90219|nr:hypothetical protein [Micromonospora sp. NBC_01813]WSA12407.1 hypothetical protein OG958_17405 [Micromonospora sp. NBC_01813]